MYIWRELFFSVIISLISMQQLFYLYYIFCDESFCESTIFSDLQYNLGWLSMKCYSLLPQTQ